MTETHYFGARQNECGLLYRPGEMSMPDMNFCRLKKGHASKLHSTKRNRHDLGGFDWNEPKPDGMEWPEETEHRGLECPYCGGGIDIEEYGYAYDTSSHHRMVCDNSSCGARFSDYGGTVERLPKSMR